MKIELTELEVKLLIETVESSTYAGRFARLVSDLLDKLRPAVEEEADNGLDPQ